MTRLLRPAMSISLLLVVLVLPALPLPCHGAPLAFPEGFLWGAATAAHQVEGGNEGNDWWDWELRPGTIAHGHRSGRAVDHWNRYEEDLDLLAGLGANAYRFSVEWSRIEPRPGEIDESALARYRRICQACRRRGLEPVVTLLHFTLPRWLAARGGLLAPDFGERFEAFARLVGEGLGDLVDLWCTVNEPLVMVGAGYVDGIFPPGMRDMPRAMDAAVRLTLAHGRAYHALHAADRADGSGDGTLVAVGVAKHWRILEAARPWDPRDQVAALALHRTFNRAFLDAATRGEATYRIPGVAAARVSDPRLRGSLDFVGINYYSRDRIRAVPGASPPLVRETPPDAELSDQGLEIYPRGLRQALEAVASYGLPVYVTENGVADATGRLRAAFLHAHLTEAHRALRRGVKLRGYFHWSLMDNFEWSFGYDHRYGLHHVNWTTLERRRAPGADLFETIARDNALPGFPADDSSTTVDVPSIAEPTRRTR